jgi:hypothetical protein
MKILHLIGWISGLALLALGFIHIIILDKIFRDKPGYLNMKWWVGKLTLALTIIFFSCGVIILTKFLIQR